MTDPKALVPHSKRRIFSLESLMMLLTILSGIALTWSIVTPGRNYVMMIVSGTVFTLALVCVVRLIMDPDSIRARQTDEMLQLANLMLEHMENGLTEKAAHEICALLLPSTAAVAVAITGRETVLGYVGYLEADNPAGQLIRTQATRDTIEDGQERILRTKDDIGFPQTATNIKAAIIVPLKVGKRIEGTLKFYFNSPQKITDTQVSIAQGFGKLLSTQMAAGALEEQEKIAASMELKALQSQINPHFLFNTINTIAALIRIEPDKARVLLREFAVFYRRTLEDSADLIPLPREIEQTQRYFSFETARFGEERLSLEVEMDPEVEVLYVPSFLIQPLVENAVRHAMPSDGKLGIRIVCGIEGDDAVVRVIDDGVGMSEEARQNIMHPESSTGCGIAVKNVHDRMRSCFGPESSMVVESELGKGTQVTLTMVGCMADE